VTKSLMVGAVFACTALLCVSNAASAELILNQIIVDLAADGPGRQDIEAFNSGDERMYVVAEPVEVIGAGTEHERRAAVANPEASGLFVSPKKIILEPGERRTIRVAALGPRPEVERVYRIGIKPVAGSVHAAHSALKVFVGYDALVLLRPRETTGELVSTREGNVLTIRNRGNSSVELFDGKQCDVAERDCRSLAGKRLYPGVEWQQATPFETKVHYKIARGLKVEDRVF
jgi:Mat/Ecp fimbriae periplasmic chaperone